MMLEQLEESHQAFRSEHAWLVSHWPPAHPDHAYFTRKTNLVESKLVLKVKRHLGRLQDKLTQPAQPAVSTEATSRVRSRLPELTVPKFSGECRLWPDFKAMFTSVIGSSKDLSELEKFQYLKSAVEGDAADLISNLAPSDGSFNSAWLLLIARYENKRLIVKSHLERVLALKPMQKRQASSLTKMVNIINQTTQALATLTNETNNDCLMVTIVSNLLDSDTREKWETSLVSSTEFPTLGQLTNFLIARARTLDSMEDDSTKAQVSQAKGAVPKRSAGHHESSSRTQASSSKTPQTAQGSTQSAPASSLSSGYPCDSCKQDHFIVVCPRFRGLSMEHRVQLIKERSLCCNCLGRHNMRKCNSKRLCKTCNGSHHTMLHGADLSSVFTSPATARTTQETPSTSAASHSA
ncbi:uncharacterized protein LOC124404734 [Diprion similis]|uniref:uncharacterized protein LOC124404733 n=1 Tax=Diprion similis TaxID=362088 RepID=UPI001EF91333|nr:uncharacterized protein LOC124404733 [Diprion similis]XP_046735024.1 uncharacterized protein LOC124404734 [Diprion similis]